MYTWFEKGCAGDVDTRSERAALAEMAIEFAAFDETEEDSDESVVIQINMPKVCYMLTNNTILKRKRQWRPLIIWWLEWWKNIAVNATDIDQKKDQDMVTVPSLKNTDTDRKSTDTNQRSMDIIIITITATKNLKKNLTKIWLVSVISVKYKL